MKQNLDTKVKHITYKSLDTENKFLNPTPD